MIPFDQKNAHILIVEREEGNNSALAGILRREGYRVISAHNFSEAMDILGKKAIGIVLTEIEIPERGGISLLKEIKKEKPEVQVIMMTDEGTVASYLESMVLGAFEYFNKPIRNGILCKVIEKALVASKQKRIMQVS